MLTNIHLMIGYCDGEKLITVGKSPNCFFQVGGLTIGLALNFLVGNRAL